MTPLRNRMIEDMMVRNLAPNTQTTYVQHIKHRTILTTCYATGLRISEAVHLKLVDIDSARMVIRVEQGKGQKDRYVMLSPRLLDTLRHWWQTARPQRWLFPGQRADK